MRSALRRAVLVAAVTATVMVTLGGCASAPATGTVRGVVRFDGDAATTTDSDDDTSPAAKCVANAQTQSDLDSCSGLQATVSTTPCVGSLASGSAVDAQTEVDVVDAAGTVVGVGRLGKPTLSSDGSACSYPFVASNVPTSHTVYGIVLGPATGAALGPVSHFTKAEAFGGKAVVEISD